MKPRPAIVLAAAWLVFLAGPARAATLPTLRWNNGESLTGEIVEASGANVSWKTPLFVQPLVLAWPAVHRIDHALKPAPFMDPFLITLRDGSSIHGQLVSITGDAVEIESTRHGDVTLKRTEVLSVRRIRGGKLLYAGPAGDVGWETLGEKVTGRGSSLLMPFWCTSAFLNVPLPQRVDIEFTVRSSARPDFRLSFGSLDGMNLETKDDALVLRVKTQLKESMNLETWDTALVLRAAAKFKEVRKLTDADRAVSLRVCCDLKTGHGWVYTASGDPVTEWQGPASEHITGSKLCLENKGRDLSLDFLRVRAWDGEPPAKIDVTKPRVELADGTARQGEVAGCAAGFLTVKAGGMVASLPLDKVDALIFSTDLPKPNPRDQTTLLYADGTLLSGSLSSIKDGTALLAVDFSGEPLPSRLAGLRQLFVSSTEAQAPPPSTLDRIKFGETILHGELTSAGDDSPRWVPVGSSTPVSPAPEHLYEITRSFPPDAKLARAAALFFTRAGDVLPGAVRGIDEKGMEFESPITRATRLPPGDLEAIQFDPETRVDLHGFAAADGWRILAGGDSGVHLSKDSVRLEAGASIGNSMALEGGAVEFTMEGGGFSVARLRLFCAGLETKDAKSLLLANYGGQFVSGMESEEGQLNERAEVNNPNGSVAVRIIIDEDQIVVIANGASLQTLPIPASMRKGAGLVIEPAQLWGNGVQALTLSHFSAVTPPGASWLPEINKETKTQALTVPRFRRNDPPREALIASNGDVLRGEIEGATANYFAFRSGLEELQVPKDRVKAAVWLQKALDTPVAAPKPDPSAAILAGEIPQVNYNTNLTTFISFIHQQKPELKFKLPPEKDDRQYMFRSFGTVGETLARVCAMCSLRYRVDADGTIIFEKPSESPQGLGEKVYWLKAGAFHDAETAEKVLADKGIAFPPGAAVRWNPDASELWVKNTPENEAKMEAVLTSDFGGSLGSPTHWLMLTSGARLGLTVQKFDKDFITGTHPVYGRCVIPTGDVCVVRNSMPGPSAAMRAVANWRLVNAPEPVLPEAGGEASALLGKEASTFKLPLLGGGEFDLSHERGKVVVLDFWATWCGPCIRSLPGMMQAMAAFPADRVKLIGVNQAEPEQQVRQFLEAHGWKLTVALDEGRVGDEYGATAIPQTVIVGPDGKIAWVQTGYDPDGESAAAKAVEALLKTSPPISVKE